MKKGMISVLCLIYLVALPVWCQDVTVNKSEIFQEALIRGEQANDALIRSLRNTDAWFLTADPITLLIPDRLGETVYTPYNSAADNYPFMILSSYYSDQNFYLTKAREILFNELRYATMPDGFPCSYDIKTREISGGNIFGASEYVKDGLMPITELIGSSIWSKRMEKLVDLIIENSKIKTDYGLLPSANSEVNGELLQAVSRLYTMTGRRKYLEFIERIGDAYCFEIIPRNFDLPAQNWDFEAKIPLPIKNDGPYIFTFSDHGNEIISGLVQLYITTKFHHPEKAQLYYKPIKAALDRMMQFGAREDGMFYYSIDVRNGKPVGETSHVYRGEVYDGIRTTHAWGYVYIAYLAFYQATGEKKYRDYVEHVLNNLDPKLSFWWLEKSTALSDVIEGVLYMVNRIPNVNGFNYIDIMTARMLSSQQPGGNFLRSYADGNVSRTAVMYTMYKTQGLRMQPWKPDLKYGAVYDNNTLHIAIQSDKKWEGRLFFDYPRSREIFHLPINYARINEFPEWFTVEPFDLYDVYNLKKNKTSLYPGIEMIEGINVNIDAGDTLYLQVNHSKK